MTNLQGLLDEALAHHHAGRLEAAEHLYRALLALEPDHAETQHNLGVLEIELGRIDEGLDHLQRALEIEPEVGRYWLGFAQGLIIAQRPEDALIVIDRAEAIGLDASLTQELRQTIANMPVERSQNQEGHGGEAPFTANPPSATECPTQTLIVTIVDRVRVCVPSDINCRITHVLLEQEDWIDEAMPFIRRLIQPGMLVLDVGANYGVYALAMAKRLCGEGRVIALEPAQAPSAMLRQSIEESGLRDVMTLIRVGLSSQTGEAALAIDAYGACIRQNNGDFSETVRLLTLDALMLDVQWPSRGTGVDVLRVDACADILSIVKGGSTFFVDQAPLIIFGIASVERIDPDLVRLLKGFEIDLYRLIPGIEALVPLDETYSWEESGRERTFFACQQARAEDLRRRELMV